MSAPGFGWVVDDAGPRKRDAGGPAAFAERLVGGQLAPCAPSSCPSCALLDEVAACVGVIEAPITAAAEQWLAQRLPAALDSLPGQLLHRQLEEGAVTGAGARALRARGLMAAPRPISRRYGPFLRGTTITTDQLLEQMLCAGDIQPAHALAILVELGGIEVDGLQPTSAEHGAALAEIVQTPAERASRTRCAIRVDEHHERSLIELQRFLRALYAAFVQDTELRLFPA